MSDVGRVVLSVGIVLVILGFILIFSTKTPFLGKLPGDFLYKKDGFTFYFPLATSIILSVILTILANIFFRK